MSINNAIAAAREYFAVAEEWAGYFIFFEGLTAGWVRHLDRPQSWQPGSLAVSRAGEVYRAMGGNSYDGASHWQIIEVRA